MLMYLIEERLNIFIFNILIYFILFYFYFIKLFFIRVCVFLIYKLKQEKTCLHLFISVNFIYLSRTKSKKTKMMLKKLKLQRSLKLINKEIIETKNQAINSTFTIHYKNNLLDELEMCKNELIEKLENKEY